MDRARIETEVICKVFLLFVSKQKSVEKKTSVYKYILVGCGQMQFQLPFQLLIHMF